MCRYCGSVFINSHSRKQLVIEQDNLCVSLTTSVLSHVNHSCGLAERRLGCFTNNFHFKFNRADWMPFHLLCRSGLSDGLVLSQDPVAQFTDIFIAKKTIPNFHVLKIKLPEAPCFNNAVNKLFILLLKVYLPLSN